MNAEFADGGRGAGAVSKGAVNDGVEVACVVGISVGCTTWRAFAGGLFGSGHGGSA